MAGWGHEHVVVGYDMERATAVSSVKGDSPRGFEVQDSVGVSNLEPFRSKHGGLMRQIFKSLQSPAAKRQRIEIALEQQHQQSITDRALVQNERQDGGVRRLAAVFHFEWAIADRTS